MTQFEPAERRLTQIHGFISYFFAGCWQRQSMRKHRLRFAKSFFSFFVFIVRHYSPSGDSIKTPSRMGEKSAAGIIMMMDTHRN
jgi:hypothetical protein